MGVDRESFARLVDALEPWLDLVVIIRGAKSHVCSAPGKHRPLCGLLDILESGDIVPFPPQLLTPFFSRTRLHGLGL